MEPKPSPDHLLLATYSPGSVLLTDTAIHGAGLSPSLLAPSLAQYIELYTDDAALSDLDFDSVSEVDSTTDECRSDSDEHEHRRQQQSCKNMKLDPNTKKWVGNELEFVSFSADVAHYAVPTEPGSRDDSLFHVPKHVLEEWKDNGVQHNRLFPNEPRSLPHDDIRNFAPSFVRG